MQEHYYPRSAITACYRRAGVGLALTAGPAIWGQPATFIAVILWGLALVFAVYGVLAFLRGITRYNVDDEGIAATGPFPRQISWTRLAALNLSYYATKMDRKDGWLELKIRGAGHTMRIESTLDGFETVVSRAVRQARARDIELSPTTLENLGHVGLSPEPEREEPCTTS